MYILYIFYQYYGNNKWESIPLERSKMIVSFLLNINVLTFGIILLPDYTVNKYFAYWFVICPVLYLLMSILVRTKNVVTSKNILRYKSSHGWLIVLYLILSFVFFGAAIASDYNPNYRLQNSDPPPVERFTEHK